MTISEPAVAKEPRAAGPIMPVLVGGLLTGLAVVVTRFALGDVPPMILSLLRMLLGGVVLSAAVIVMGSKLPNRASAYGQMAVGGILGVGIPVIGFTLALRGLSSGVSSVFTSLFPLATALIEFVWLGAALTRIRLAGLGIAFGGALALILTRTTGIAEQSSGDLTNYLIALASVVGGAFGSVYSRKMLPDVDTSVVGAGQTFAGMLLAVPFIAPELGTFDPAAVSQMSWLSVLGSGVLGSAAAYLLFVAVLQKHGATTASMTGYVVALSASLLGALLLGEIITPIFLVGAALILGGVFFVSR